MLDAIYYEQGQIIFDPDEVFMPATVYTIYMYATALAPIALFRYLWPEKAISGDTAKQTEEPGDVSSSGSVEIDQRKCNSVNS